MENKIENKEMSLKKEHIRHETTTMLHKNKTKHY